MKPDGLSENQLQLILIDHNRTNQVLYPISDVAHMFERREMHRAARPNISGSKVFSVGVGCEMETSTIERITYD